MGDNAASLVYEEAISIKVGTWLLQKGFGLASCIGIAESRIIENCALGILSDSAAKPEKRLFGLVIQKSRRWFLGTIWFNDDLRGADEENWVFEFHGREHIESLSRLAEEMASVFGVKITSRLISEESEIESFESDFND